MTEDEIKRNKRKLGFGVFVFIVFLAVMCACCSECTSSKKDKKAQTKQTVQKEQKAQKALPQGNYPDYCYYNSAQYSISGKIEQDGKVFAITQVPDFERFTDEDFLKTAKLVDESDYKYLEIRFEKQKTSMVLQKGIAQISSLYGVTAENGGINKTLLWFVNENGKVLRLNEKQIKEYDSQ